MSSDMIREGKVLVQRAGQTAPVWEECWLSLSATRLDCYGPPDGSADPELLGSVSFCPEKSANVDEADLRDPELDGIPARREMLELLPDHARSSRHNTIFPFYVGPPKEAAMHGPECNPDAAGPAAPDGLMLAVQTADQMWDWAVDIRFAGRCPATRHPPALRCNQQAHLDNHFVEPAVLQEEMLHCKAFYQASKRLDELIRPEEAALTARIAAADRENEASRATYEKKLASLLQRKLAAVRGSDASKEVDRLGDVSAAGSANPAAADVPADDGTPGGSVPAAEDDQSASGRAHDSSMHDPTSSDPPPPLSPLSPPGDPGFPPPPQPPLPPAVLDEVLDLGGFDAAADGVCRSRSASEGAPCEDEDDDEPIHAPWTKPVQDPRPSLSLRKLRRDAKLMSSLIDAVDEFASVCLAGASIHAAERCFELVLSSELVNLKTLPKIGNQPLSLCMEGDYTASRTAITLSLLDQGVPIGAEVRAGTNWTFSSFVAMLCKPVRIKHVGWTITSLCGAAVHEDDKKLVRLLIDNGDGIEFNDAFEKAFADAAFAGDTSLQFNTELLVGMTEIRFPLGDTLQWRTEVLTDLDLSHNCLTTLPEALFDLKALTKLNLSTNCLWELSPRIRNLGHLVMLELDNNCLEGLPDALEALTQLDQFTCASNPIIYPPQSVVGQGLPAIRQFFMDGRRFGKRKNTDMKVLVLGLSEAGKTSLINGLVEPQSRLMRRGDRTVGIEQRSWSFSRPDPDAQPPTDIFGQIYGDSEDISGMLLSFHFPTGPEDSFLALPGCQRAERWFALTNDAGKLHKLPPTKQFQNASWDPQTRTFVGDIVWDPLMFNGARLWHWEIRFSADFEEAEGGEFKTYTWANDLLPSQLTNIGPMEMITLGRTPAMLPEVNLLLYDFAGQQEYYVTHHLFLTSRALYILAFDLSKYSKVSFSDQIQFWVNTIQDRVPRAKLIIVGTHADAMDESAAFAKCDHVLQTLQNKRHKVVTQNGAKTEEIRKRLKALRELRDANKKAGDPELTAVETAEELDLEAALDKMAAELDALVDLPSVVIPVSSAATLFGMDALRAAIKHAVQDTTFFPQMDELIPLSYLHVRNAIRAKRHELPYMETGRFAALLSSELSQSSAEDYSPDEVLRATRFMHDCGECLYYKAEVPDVVFLRVSYLVDALKFVIRHDHAEATSYHRWYATGHAGLPPMSEAEFVQAKAAMLQRGELGIGLLERLWSPAPPKGLGLKSAEDPQRFYAMVKLLELFEIAAVVDTDVDGRPTELVVPQFKQQKLPADRWLDDAATATLPGHTELKRWFQFADSPPRGIMQRLQVRLCTIAPDQTQRCFAKEGAIVELGDCAVMCRIVAGNDHTPRPSPGMELIVRGHAAAVWPALTEMLHEIQQLLREYPGLFFDQYVVYPMAADVDLTPEPGVATVHLLVQQLESQRRAGVDTKLLGGFIGAAVCWSDLLGPLLETESASTALDDGGDVASDVSEKEDREMDGSSLTDARATELDALAVITGYREKEIKWAMLLHTPESRPLAMELFAGLTNLGVAVWVSLSLVDDEPSISGSAATGGVGSPEAALASAAALIPIITPGFKSDPDCKALMTQACHAEVLIAPVLGDPATQPSGWVGLTLASADPLPYSPTKFHPELSPDQQHDAIAALADELKAGGLALADTGSI